MVAEPEEGVVRAMATGNRGKVGAVSTYTLRNEGVTIVAARVVVRGPPDLVVRARVVALREQHRCESEARSHVRGVEFRCAQVCLLGLPVALQSEE